MEGGLVQVGLPCIFLGKPRLSLSNVGWPVPLLIMLLAFRVGAVEDVDPLHQHTHVCFGDVYVIDSVRLAYILFATSYNIIHSIICN